MFITKENNNFEEEKKMKRSKGNSDDVLNLMVDWQDIETGHILSANREIPKARNPLTKTMLKVIRLEAEKNSLLQQMIIESVKKEAVRLSPEDLADLSGHLNKYLEIEEKALSRAEATENNELVVPRWLLTYFVSGLKTGNRLLREFDDELKAASIPSSFTSRNVRSAMALNK
jgi:hypothetical protein